MDGQLYAAIGSSIVITLGMLYKAFIMIKGDLRQDEMICIPKDKVRYVHVETEQSPLDKKINEIRTIIKEMEYHHVP